MGRRSRYVASASDDGHIFVWDLQSAELLNMLPGADGDNCVQASQAGACFAGGQGG